MLSVINPLDQKLLQFWGAFKVYEFPQVEIESWPKSTFGMGSIWTVSKILALQLLLDVTVSSIILVPVSGKGYGEGFWPIVDVEADG